MPEPAATLRKVLDRYEAELVRWNRQINLVSRQDTAGRVTGLVRQCERAWRVLEQEVLSTWDPRGGLWYFDLGSGGGLPGFVWHLLAAERFGRVRSVLVEPREKRAWFLQRLNALAAGNPLEVWRARWGEAPAAGTGPETPGKVLISLKALYLTDQDVLAGLDQALPAWPAVKSARAATEIWIVRFYPAGQAWTPDLAATLGAGGTDVPGQGIVYRALRQGVLPAARPTDAALVFSAYRLSCSP